MILCLFRKRAEIHQKKKKINFCANHFIWDGVSKWKAQEIPNGLYYKQVKLTQTSNIRILQKQNCINPLVKHLGTQSQEMGTILPEIKQ